MLVSCGKATAPQPSTTKTPSTQTERIIEVTAIIKERTALPSRIIDAHFKQVAMGNTDDAGSLVVGPTDYESYLYAKVPVQEIGQWISTFTRMNARPGFVAPKGANPWWIDKQNFASLEFFEPNALTFGSLGWIGVSRKSGEIFLYTYTQ